MKTFTRLFNELMDKPAKGFNPDKGMSSITIHDDPRIDYIPNFGEMEEYDLADSIYAYAYKENQPDGNYFKISEDYDESVEELEAILSKDAIAFEFAIGQAGKARSWEITDVHKINPKLPMQIMATAKASIEYLLRDYNPPVLMFTATEPSRKKLYDALVKRADTKYEKLSWDNGPYREYVLIDPKIINEVRSIVREIESDRQGPEDEDF